MSSVWVVSSGDYDESFVVAVFSTEDKAREFIGVQSPGKSDPRWTFQGEAYFVEEQPVDSLPPLEWSDRWEVEMDWGGSVTVKQSRRTDRQPKDNGGAWEYPYGIAAYSWVSEDHAIKLADECRQKYLREHDGKPPE